MKIDIKAKDDEGNIAFEGSFNRKEVGFLLAYAVNDLMMAGVTFNMLEDTPDVPDDEDDRPVRFYIPPTGDFNS